jgi:UDP-N-acetylmuramyl pentapeptide phosphotransferase/UDP-N-acetylglucosamine-1-phosphate transferase
MENLVAYSLSALVTFLGIACIRVGITGQYLGTAKLVSYVKKHPEEPQLYHRRITVGVGAVMIFIGVGFLVFLLDELPRTK